MLEWLDKRLRLWQVWAAIVAALLAYGYLIWQGLTQAAANPHVPLIFDLRITGYDLETARDILSAMGETGRRHFLQMQRTADTLFPILSALAQASAFLWLTRPDGDGKGEGWGSLMRWGCVALALATGALDLAENTATARLVSAFPQLTAADVAVASRFTLLKFSAYGLSFSVLAWLVFRRFRSQRSQQ